MTDLRSRSVMSVDRFAAKLRRSVPAVVLATAASLLVSLPAAANAKDPALPPGASTEPPKQPAGEVSAPASVTAAETQGRRGAGASEPEKLPKVAPFAAMPDRSAPPTVNETRHAAAEEARAEGKAVEDVSARTPRSTEFIHPDGRVTAKFYDEVAFVPDPRSPDGALRPVSTDLVLSGAARLVPQAAADVSFAVTSGPGRDLGRLSLPAGSVGFALDGAAPVMAVVDANAARYRAVARDTDVVLYSTPIGVKEEIVLHSAQAPRSFRFPLTLDGLTPKLHNGQVLLLDRRLWPQAVIPAGFMRDSSVHPQSGGPAKSHGVTYGLVREQGTWVLTVDLDSAWLDDPARVWPVVADPSVQQWRPEGDDTYVISAGGDANEDNSGESELLAGTWNSGGEKAAGFMHFSGAMSALAGRTVLKAKVGLWNTWSFSCNAAPASLHRITQAWSGSSTTTYPGPTTEATAVATATFAYGYTPCPSQNWGIWDLPVNRVQAWVNGTETFHGLSVQASTTSSSGWKRFWSNNYSNGNMRPFLEVEYVDNPPQVSQAIPVHGATVDTLTPTLWVLPSTTNATDAKFKVCGGTQEAPTSCQESAWQAAEAFAVPAAWMPGWSRKTFWWVKLRDFTESAWLGGYQLTPVIAQPPVTSHLAGAPEGADIPGVNAQVGNWSTTVIDANVAVAGPALSVSRTYNSQDPRTDGAFGPGWSTPLDQRIEADSDGSGNVVLTLPTGRQVRFARNPDGSYEPPPGMNLTLVYGSSPPTWTVRDATGTRRVFDGPTGRLVSVTDADGRAQNYTYNSSNLALNRPATSSTICVANETAAKAFNGTTGGGGSPRSGARSLRRGGCRSTWAPSTTSPDSRSTTQGRAARRRWNTRNFTIQISDDAVTWRTPVSVLGNTADVTSHPVNASGRYVKLNVSVPTSSGDAAARIYEFQVFGGKLTTVTDAASTRSLHLTWTGNRVTEAKTDVPAAGINAPKWTYTYTSGRLTSVCTPCRPRPAPPTTTPRHRTTGRSSSTTIRWATGRSVRPRPRAPPRTSRPAARGNSTAPMRDRRRSACPPARRPDRRTRR